MTALLALLLLVAPINLQIYPEKKEVLLGEKTSVEIVIPNMENREIKGIELDSPDVHVFKKKFEKDRFSLEIGLYALGEKKIPVKIYFTENGKPQEKEMPGFKIKVVEAELKKPGIRPIKDVLGMFNPLWLLLILPFLAVFGYLLFKKKEGTVSEEAAVSPRQLAQQRLQNIKREDLPGQRKFKEYYDSISDCLRVYLKEKYDISAPESTLYELQTILKEKFTSATYVKIRDLLQECDWIKFAPEGEEPENIEGIWERAYNMVSYEL